MSETIHYRGFFIFQEEPASGDDCKEIWRIETPDGHLLARHAFSLAGAKMIVNDLLRLPTSR